ncbi:MAG: hypothetical protein OEX03_13365 [Gammaproteobacteria bacterium]|nr:hypothetical protein [Gammaproteobacteria bacterium]
MRGHLLVDKVAGGSGINPNNLTPITRSANAQMYWKIERYVKRWLMAGNVLRYIVRKNPPTPGTLIPRWICESSGWVLRTVPEEQLLPSSLSLEVRKKKYDPNSKRWVLSSDSNRQKNKQIQNVPSYPSGMPTSVKNTKSCP